MLNPSPGAGRSRGFTIIELMFSIAVLVVLITLAMPSFRTWMQNIQIRNATASVLSGIQRARAEAVTRNTDVAFVMAADSSWSVNIVASGAVIETRTASEGSLNVTRTVLPGGATAITFNSLGVVVPNADASAGLSQIDFAAEGGSQNLRIVIGAGGNARMCGPNGVGSGASAC